MAGKNTFRCKTFAAATFAGGTFNGLGVTAATTLRLVNGRFLVILKGIDFNFLAGYRNEPAQDVCAYDPAYTVPVSDTALPLGPLASARLAYFKNLDAVNNVVIKGGIGGTILVTLKPGQSVFLLPYQLIAMSVPLVVQGVGSPSLEYCLWPPP